MVKTKKTKKTIYWLHTHFLLPTGGTRFVYEVIKALTQTYNVNVLVERSNTEWKELYQRLGIQITEISTHTSNSLLYWALFPLFFCLDFWQLKKAIPRNSIIVSSMFPMHILARMCSTKSIYYCFEPFSFFYDDDFINSFSKPKQFLMRLLAFALSWLDKLAVKNSRTVLTINPSVGKWVESIYHRPVDGWTLLGVDTNHFSPTGKLLVPKSDDEFRVFHSTDYSPLKGTPFLLEAMKQLQDSPRIVLYISETMSNPGEKQKYLDFIQLNSLKSRVIFIGHLAYVDLPAMYRSCDLYCFTGNPSSKGATAASMSVLEAEATGLPVIRSIGNQDEVVSGTTGYVLDPRNSKKLAQAIRVLSQSPATTRKMAQSARHHVIKNYSWPQVATVLSAKIEMLSDRDRMKV